MRLETASFGAPRGKPVVLLPAFTFAVEGLWRPAIDALSLRGNRVLAVDFPGFGRSRHVDPRGAPAKIATLAQAVAQAMERHKIQNAVVVDASLGGYVAQELAATRPDLVSGLGLVATRVGTDPPQRRAETARRSADLDKDPDLFLAWFKANLVSAWTRQHQPEIVSRIQNATATLADATALRWTWSAVARRADHTATLDAFAGPIALIVGADDERAAEARELAGRTRPGGITLHAEIAHAGHMVPYEAPTQVAAAVLNLIDAGHDLRSHRVGSFTTEGPRRDIEPQEGPSTGSSGSRASG